jgi:putative transposase
MARIEPVAGLPTVWAVPDELWEGFLLPILKRYDRAPRTGRPRIDQRKAFDGVIYILRSGCQWNRLPKEFGDDASVHRTFQRWVRRKVFWRLWGALVGYARRLGLVDWEWQSADCAMGKARKKGGRPARTRRTGPSRAPSVAS